MKPKTKFWIFPMVALGLILFFATSCKKDDPEPTTVADIDGNVYNTVKIGNQLFTATNLKTTKYNDGTAIPLVTNNDAWGNLSTGTYCWYNNEVLNGSAYGALYNWYAVNTGKLCPTGWRVPSQSDWETLIAHLGGADAAGGKLKESELVHWNSPNTGATNESGFTGLPGGIRSFFGTYFYNKVAGHWWSSTLKNEESAWSLGLYYDFIGVDLNWDNDKSGFSVRCIKN